MYLLKRNFLNTTTYFFNLKKHTQFAMSFEQLSFEQHIANKILNYAQPKEFNASQARWMNNLLKNLEDYDAPYNLTGATDYNYVLYEALLDILRACETGDNKCLVNCGKISGDLVQEQRLRDELKRRGFKIGMTKYINTARIDVFW